MTRLTPRAEELVQASREALLPSEADRARVFQALLPWLAGGLEGLNALSTAPATASGIAVKVAAAIVVISVAGGGLFLPDEAAARKARCDGTGTLGCGAATADREGARERPIRGVKSSVLRGARARCASP